MKKIFYIILIFTCGHVLSQTITPHVLNSAGSQRFFGTANSGASVTDNVGEPFTQTIGPSTAGSIVITQGFIQPENFSIPGFTVDAFVTDVFCSGKNDGRISTAITTSAFSYSAAFFWKPSSLCPTNNCSSIDSLKAGSYGLTVIFTYTTISNAIKHDTLLVAPVPSSSLNAGRTLTVRDENGPCRLKIFTGITINGDGQNDHLFIENVSEFPNNTVTIFNRWGAQLYQEKGYDNINKFWPTPDEANKLVPSTYFYVVDPGDGSKPIKGWIEIIKN